MSDASQERAIKTLRFLSADMVQQANSGHPGLPMGDAAIAYTLWGKHLRHNPRNPSWPGRDRFILSGGHGSALLYSLLHLTGYDLGLDELKNFRQWGSRTPGHPEWGLTPGVEITTGPLGQGFACGVGMAAAQLHLAAEFNRPGFTIFDSFIYAIVTDGDLMEGVTSEAASLAGHLGLGKLVYLYDDNHISIDGSTNIAFTEDRAARFRAYGWQTIEVADGNDVNAIDTALCEAKKDPRPSLILCRTVIGYGLPHLQGTEKAHGAPPGEAELLAAKKLANWPEDKFHIPEDVLAVFRKSVVAGEAWEASWRNQLRDYRAAHPELADELDRRLSGRLRDGWENAIPVFPPDPKGMATRSASGKVLNSLARVMPEIVGGSADLCESTCTAIAGFPGLQKETPEGRTVHFGVREHGMGSMVSGMAVFGGLRPYGGGFFIFSDYMRPAIRLSALSKYPTIWVFTHDSIGLGEDGATHQPVEHLISLRAIPGLVTIRPADANETAEAWRTALLRTNGPTALILSRQALPVIDRTVFPSAEGLARGAYVLADFGGAPPALVLMASGSEVNLILEAGKEIADSGVPTRVVSFPSWELFARQSAEYRECVLPSAIRPRLAVEAGSPIGWERWVGGSGKTIGIEGFGASAPIKILMEKYGFSKEHIIQEARSLFKS